MAVRSPLRRAGLDYAHGGRPLPEHGAPVEDARAEGAQRGLEGVEVVAAIAAPTSPGSARIQWAHGRGAGRQAATGTPPRRKRDASSAREPRRYKGFSAAR